MLDLSVYLVTDRPLCLGRDLEHVVAAAVEGGATMVQLREKTATTREFVELARRLHGLLQPLGVPLLINDRADVALAAEVDGLHIGQRDMEYADARRIMGHNALIGLTIDSEEQLQAANALDVDYLGVGPVFPTSTKPGHSPVWGLEGIARARQLSRHKMVAIGGITAEHAASIVQCGADGIAVVSAICSAQDPAQAARELARAVQAGRQTKQEQRNA